jgi:hypothetical protein
MALRATEGNEKPAGGEDAANEWRVEAGFSTERPRKSLQASLMVLGTIVHFGGESSPLAGAS